MQKKHIFKSLIFLLVACLLTVVSIFAYFSITNLKSPKEEFILETNTLGHTLIRSELDLIIAGKYSYYEAYEDTSVKELRKNLEFLNNITLSNDIMIDSDININFNGKKLDLNGKILLIRHNFFGNLTLFNGEIIDSVGSGKVIIETPNCALFLAENLLYSPQIIEVRQFNFETAKNEVFKDIDKYLIHFKENDKYVGYFIDDLPYFPTYKGLPIKIEYSSDNEAVVNNYGVVKQQSTDMSVKLTVKVFDNYGAFEIKEYNIIVLNNNSDYLDIGLKTIEDYLSRYIIENEGEIIYFYNQPISLIKNLEYYGLTFSYEDESKVYLNDYILNIGAPNTPNKVTVTVTSKDGNSKSVIYTFLSFSETNYEIMNAFVNRLGSISIINTTSEIVLISKTNSVSHNILWVEYILKNGAEVYYEIMNRLNQTTGETEVVLKVKRMPTIYDKLYLNVKLTFISGTPIMLEKDISIVLTNSSGSGGSGEGEDFYNNIYTNLNVKLAEITKSGLVKEFRLSTEEDGVIIKYGIEGNENGNNLYPFIKIDENDAGRFIIDTSLLPITQSDIVIKIYFGVEEKLYNRELHFSLLGVLQKVRDIKDNNLYNIIMSLADNNSDNILTVIEGENCNLPFIIDGSMAISSFIGLQYLKNISQITIQNNDIEFSLAEDNFFNSIIGDNIISLTMNNCNIKNLNFSNMTNLVYLDLSNVGQNNKNAIGNLLDLPLFPNLSTLKLNNITFISYDGIQKQLQLRNIYIDNGEILFKPLVELNYLEKVILNEYNGTLYDYNVTTYVIMYRKNIKFVYGENETLLAPPTSEEKVGTEILESIIYFNSGKELTLPIKLGEFNIIWKKISNGEVIDTSSAVNNEVIINGVSGIIELEASVIINNVTLKKLFVIELEA